MWSELAYIKNVQFFVENNLLIFDNYVVDHIDSGITNIIIIESEKVKFTSIQLQIIIFFSCSYANYGHKIIGFSRFNKSGNINNE